MQDFRYRLRGVTERLRSGESGRAKLIVVGVVLAIVLIWLLVNLLPLLRTPPRAQELDSPGWQIAQKLNEQLAAEPLFVDTSFIVVSESPLRLRLVGGVHAPEDLDELRDYLAEIRPEGDYEIEVEVLEVE